MNMLNSATKSRASKNCSGEDIYNFQLDEGEITIKKSKPTPDSKLALQ
jgi:hypothetical protein